MALFDDYKSFASDYNKRYGKSFNEDDEEEEKKNTAVQTGTNNFDDYSSFSQSYNEKYQKKTQEQEIDKPKEQKIESEPVKDIQKPVVEEKKNIWEKIKDTFQKLTKLTQAPDDGTDSDVDKEARKRMEESTMKEAPTSEVLKRYEQDPVGYLVSRPYYSSKDKYLEQDKDLSTKEVMEKKLKAYGDYYNSLDEVGKAKLTNPVEGLSDDSYAYIKLNTDNILKETDLEIQTLYSQLETAEGKDARQIKKYLGELEEQKKDLEYIQKGVVENKGFIEGIKEGFTDVKNIPVVGSFVRADEAITTLRAWRKYENGEELDTREKMLVNRLKSAEIESISDQKDIGYGIASGIATSASLIVEVGLALAIPTPVDAEIALATRGAGGVGKVALAGGKLLWEAGKVTLNPVVGVPKIIAGTAEYQAPEMSFDWEENDFDKVGEGDKFSDALLKSIAKEYGNNLIEVGLGSTLDASTTAVQKGIANLVGKEIQATSKNQVITFLRTKGGWNGFLGEFAEEIAQKYYEEGVIDNKEVKFTPEELATIAGSVLILQGAGEVVGQFGVDQDSMREQIEAEAEANIRATIEQADKRITEEGGATAQEEVGTETTTREVGLAGMVGQEIEQQKSATEIIEQRALEPESIKILDNEKSIVENETGKEALLAEVPVSMFGKPEFETLAQDTYIEGQRQITSPIEVTLLNDGSLRITDGANRFSQAVANKDITIPAVVIKEDGSIPTLAEIEGKTMVKAPQKFEEKEITRKQADGMTVEEMKVVLDQRGVKYEENTPRYVLRNAVIRNEGYGNTPQEVVNNYIASHQELSMTGLEYWLDSNHASYLVNFTKEDVLKLAEDNKEIAKETKPKTQKKEPTKKEQEPKKEGKKESEPKEGKAEKPKVAKASKEAKVEGLVGDNQRRFTYKNYEFITTETVPRSAPSPVPLDTSKKVLMLYGQTEDGWTFVENKIGLEPFTNKQLDVFIDKYQNRLIKAKAEGLVDNKIAMLESKAQAEYEKKWDKLTPQQQHKVLMSLDDGQRYIKTIDQDTLVKLGKGVDILSLKDTAVGDKQEIFLWGGQREGLYTDGMILFTDKPVVKKIIDKFQEQYITKEAQRIRKAEGISLAEAKKKVRAEFTTQRIKDMSFPETQPILDSAKANHKLTPIGFYADETNRQSGSIIFRAENGTLVRLSGKYYSAIKSFYPSAEFYITDESNVKPVSFMVGKSRKGIVMPMMLPTDATLTNLVGKEGVDEAKEMQKIAEEKRDEEYKIKRAKELKEGDVKDDIGLGIQEYIYDGKKPEQIPTHKGKIGYLEQGTYQYSKDTGKAIATLADGRKFIFEISEIYDWTVESIAKSRVDGRTWMEETLGKEEFERIFPNGIPKKEAVEDDDIAFYTTARRRGQRRYDQIESMADIRRNLDILRKDRLGTNKKEYYHSTSGVRLGRILDSKVLKSESRGKTSFADNLDFSMEYGDVVFVTSQINPIKETDTTSRYGTEYVQKGEIPLSKIDRILLKVDEQEGLDTRIKLDLKMSKTAGEVAFDLRDMGFEVRFVVNGREVGEGYFTASDDQLMITDSNNSYMYKWNPKDEKSEFVYHGTSEVIRGDWKFPLYLSFNKEYADTYQRLGASSLGKIKLGGGEKTYTFKKAPNERILDTRNSQHLDLLEEYFNEESVSGAFYPSDRGLPDWTEAEGIAQFVENKNLPFDALLVDEGGIPDPYSEGVIDRGIGYVALNRNGILQPDPSELQAKEDESKGSQSLETYEAREVTPAEQLKMSDEVKSLVHKYADKVGEKYLPRGVLGVFYGKTKEIRLKGITDLYVASHEISHAIDKKYDITARVTARDSVDMQLREAYINLYPTAKETHAIKIQKMEGFAMAVATYIQRPSSFAQEYPVIVREMFTQGGKYYNSEIGEYLNDVSNIVSRYQSLNDLDRVATRISKDIPVVEQTLFKSKTEATVNMLQNDLNLFERWVKENGDTMTKADFTNLFRFRTQVKHIYENNIATNLSKKNVEEGKVKNLMGGLYSYLRKSVAQDVYMVYDPETKNIKRKYDFNWGTLRREIAQKGMDRQFNSLLVARRAYYDFEYADKLKQDIETIKVELERLQDEVIEMYQKKEGERNKGEEKAKELEIEGTKVVLQEVEENLAEVEKLLKNDGWDRRLVTDAYLNNQGLFEKELDMFDKLVSQDILLAKNVGIISNEKYNELKDNKGYAPFKRIIYDEVLGEVDPSEISGNLKLSSREISSLKKRTGSTKEIIYPLQSAMRNHMEFLNKSVSQDAINTFLSDRTMELHSANIKQVEWHKGIENQKDILIRMENGVRKAYAVDPMIKELLSGYLSPRQVDLLERVQQSYKQLFTVGTTGTYFQFVFTNLPRDAFNYITQTYQSSSIKAVYNLFADTAKVILGGSPDNNLELQYFQKYLALGGREMTFVKYMEGDYDAFTSFLRQEEKGLKKIKSTVGKVAKVGLDILSMPSQLSEMWYRSVEFIEAKKSGDSDVVALEKARRVTTPFHHRGSFKFKDSKGNVVKAPALPKYAPFQNASLQAFAWAGGNFIKDPKIRSRMLFMIALTTALGLEELLRAWSGAGDDDKEQFKDLTAEDLSRFIHLPKKGGGIRRIAVAEWAGSIAGTINMAVMDFILEDDVDYNVTDYATALTTSIPDQFNLLTPVIKLLEKGTWDEFGKWGTSLLPALANPIIAVMGYKTYPEFAPLESDWQKSKLPADRYNEGTSKFAKWAMSLELPFDRGRLGDNLNLSPLQLDAILTQSFGRTIGMITGKPEAWDVLKSVNREYYFEYGRRLNNYWDAKEKNDQLYDSMTKGTREYSKEKELEVFRRKTISKDIDEALDEYREAYDNKDIEKIESTRARVIELVTRYNENPSTPEMEIYLSNPNASTMEEAMRARALREISMKDPRDYTKDELADAKALAKEFRQEALLARSDYSYSELLFGITKNDDKVVKIEEVIEGKSKTEVKKYLASLKYAGMISNDVIIKLYNTGVIDYELGKWANDLESNRNF